LKGLKMKFKNRHIGNSNTDTTAMLGAIGYSNLDQLCEDALPKNISYQLPPFPDMSETEYDDFLNALGKKNRPNVSLIGQGFYPNHCPAVIRRNILENPSWYTQYTPYQAEISQGRLEALFNFQTIVAELTKLPVANASLLDEGNACSEAIFMAYQANDSTGSTCFIDEGISDNNLRVIQTRFKYLNVEIEVGKMATFTPSEKYFSVVVPQFSWDGKANNPDELFLNAKQHNITCIMTTDLLALTLFTPPGELHADIAVGSAQRLGTAMGNGGPSAGFIACDTGFTRLMPGRIIGLSIDKYGNQGYRMALQTREQHIRRERATSNICTAQSLLAIINSFYVVYHGPHHLKQMATTIHHKASYLANAFKTCGFKVNHDHFFDTVTVQVPHATECTKKALAKGIEWFQKEGTITIALNECVTSEDMMTILDACGCHSTDSIQAISIPRALRRHSTYLNQAVFNKYHSETSLLRYIKSLEHKDMSLTHAMIPLGSCTMKLNATTQLQCLSNPNFTQIHPQSNDTFKEGYRFALNELSDHLSKITGFDDTSLQPNSGAQGEFLGLLCIRDYFASIGEGHRNIAFVPTSAHGTNPASASLCGLTIVSIKTTATGDICMDDLTEKIKMFGESLAVLMITYPSTFGVFESSIEDVCDAIHAVGAQVYMDGANMNAQVGLTSPASIGADVCHLNLHKTFCIPHGGGGPGVGPVCVKSHLAPFLPKHSGNAIANAPDGSASICLISYAYIKLMGSEGLKIATQQAILNANYIANKLAPHY